MDDAEGLKSGPASEDKRENIGWMVNGENVDFRPIRNVCD